VIASFAAFCPATPPHGAHSDAITVVALRGGGGGGGG
jgi:hypothetical protein